MKFKVVSTVWVIMCICFLRNYTLDLADMRRGKLPQDDGLFWKAVDAYKTLCGIEEDKADIMAINGMVEAAGLAAEIGVTAKAIEKHLAKLKAEGIIERVGPDKGGSWKVK